MSKTQSVYERLADRLSRTPNGLPRSPKGTELKVLAKMFSPEQAELGAAMRMRREDAATIAARAGVEEKAALATLKGMARRGLVSVRRGEKGLVFGLEPFVVGSYEESLPYYDKEMAELFEQLVQETRGEGMVGGPGPSLVRVIPVQQAVPADIELAPYERVSALVENAKDWGVRECICRKQRELIGQRCEYPKFNCVNFAPVEGVFAHLPHVRQVTKEEALRILREAEEAGLVHTVYNYQQDIHYICNCCPCCCGILRGVVEFGQAHALAHSNYIARVDDDACVGCEACLERCHFGALAMDDGVCHVDGSKCMGCGLCVSACPSDALSLEQRKASVEAPPPVDRQAWQQERADARGVPLDDLV